MPRSDIYFGRNISDIFNVKNEVFGRSGGGVKPETPAPEEEPKQETPVPEEEPKQETPKQETPKPDGETAEQETVSGNDAQPEMTAAPQSVMLVAAPAPQANNIAPAMDGCLTQTAS